MKNNKFTKALILAVSCLLLIGVVFGISAFAESGAKSVEIEYKNVSYTGAPSLVYYVGTDAPLAENQKIKMLFWNTKNTTNIYNEYTAEYSKYSESEATIDGKTYYTVIGEGTAPSEVRLSVFAKPALVEVGEDGSEKIVSLGKLLEYSIFDYALDMFNAKVNGERGAAAEDQVEIYKAFLDYAAAVQEKLFTNAYNGVVNEKKLAEVGGWANAYYVIQVNRYLYDSAKHEYVADGENIRYSARQAGEAIVISSDMYYEKAGTTYAFKSYRDENGMPLNLVKTLGSKEYITSKSAFSNVYETSAQREGVVEYNMYYGVKTGSYISFDGGMSVSDLGSKDFWAQYDAKTDHCYSTMKSAKITRYYYIPDSVSDPIEVKHFYAANGGTGNTFNDYHYIAIKNSDNKPATGKITNASNYEFIDINSVDPRIKIEVVDMNSRGYADVVKAPAGSDAERGNVLTFVKHFYDLSDPEKTTYTLGPDYQNAINGKYKTQGFVQALGSLNISGDGKSASMLTGNAKISFTNNSPAVVTDPNCYTVHVADFDFYLDSDQYGSTLVQIMMAGGGMFKVNLAINKDTGVYLYDETGPAYQSGERYDASGNAINGTVLAGVNGSTAVGKQMQTKNWYNLRIEYIDRENDQATVLFYIDGELVSYIRGGQAASDSKMSSLDFNFATGTRCSYFYADNMYVATEGNYKVPEQGEGPSVDVDYYDAVYTGGEGDYHGQGKYAELAAQIDKSFKPTNGLNPGVTIVDDKLSSGDKNTALHMLKNSGSGVSAGIAADNVSGNLYIFETDLKVIGSDNTSQWMFKFSLQDKGIASPGDNNEMTMVCLMYKEGYWTLSYLNNVYDSNLKFKLNEWHNLRFEFNPANDSLKVWVNNVEVYKKESGYNRSGSGSDASYVGMNMNVRAWPEGTVYTEVLFDNIYTTTEYRDYHGIGENYGSADKYDNETNGYLSTTGTTISKEPAHNRGHEYIFETDIRWNGVTGFDTIDATTAKVLDFVMKSGSSDIFSINGITTNAAESDLLLKVGTVTVATLARGYWMNLRIVYTPHEAEEIEGELIYKATYIIYVNGAEAYSVTVESDRVETFDEAILVIDGTEDGVIPSIDIDNTYTAARYVDDHGNGDNFSESNQQGDGDLTVNDNASASFETSISIGSLYIFESDIKWISGAGSISLKSVSGDDFTVYIIPDNTDPGYAKLSLTSNIDDAFFTVYTGIWYNVQIVAQDDVYAVNIAGKERIAVERELAANCIGAQVVASNMTVDNTYVAVENKNYAGNGENKENSINNFTQEVSGGSVVFDPNLNETDANNKYTDAYVTVSKSQIILGKNTAMSETLVSFLGGKASDLHIFESDFVWGGTEFGVETPLEGTDEGTFFTVTIKDADGNAILTIYAVGVYDIDTLDRSIKFLKLYTSVEDVKNGNAFAYICEGVTFNLRVEYAASGDYEIFVNNKSVNTGKGGECAAMSGVDVALGNNVYDTKLTLKFTAVISK